MGKIMLNGVNYSSAPDGNIYSTTEHVVGTWIDGSTIYEKTLQFANDVEITNNTWTILSDYDGLAQIIDKVIEAQAYISSSIGWGIQPIAMQKVSGHLQVQLARFYSPSTISIVTIQYTKAST